MLVEDQSVEVGLLDVVEYDAELVARAANGREARHDAAALQALHGVLQALGAEQRYGRVRLREGLGVAVPAPHLADVT